MTRHSKMNSIHSHWKWHDFALYGQVKHLYDYIPIFFIHFCYWKASQRWCASMPEVLKPILSMRMCCHGDIFLHALVWLIGSSAPEICRMRFWVPAIQKLSKFGSRIFKEYCLVLLGNATSWTGVIWSSRVTGLYRLVCPEVRQRPSWISVVWRGRSLIFTHWDLVKHQNFFAAVKETYIGFLRMDIVFLRV